MGLDHLVDRVLENPYELVKIVSGIQRCHGKRGQASQILLYAQARQRGNRVVYPSSRIDGVEGGRIHVLELQPYRAIGSQADRIADPIWVAQVKLDPQLGICALRDWQPVQRRIGVPSFNLHVFSLRPLDDLFRRFTRGVAMAYPDFLYEALRVPRTCGNPPRDSSVRFYPLAPV